MVIFNINGLRYCNLSLFIFLGFWLLSLVNLKPNAIRIGALIMEKGTKSGESRKDRVVAIVFLAGIVCFFVIFLFSLFFFGFAGIFALFGVQYDSIWSLVLFVAAYFLIGFIVEIFFDGLRKVAVQYTNHPIESFIVQMGASFVGNYLVISIVELIISGIRFALASKLAIIFLLSLLDVVFDNKKKIDSFD